MKSKKRSFLGGDIVAKTAEEKVMENLEIIEKWALEGVPQKEICKYLNIGYSTFGKIKRENIALLAVLEKSATYKRNREKEKNKNVEKSLYERATGYNYEIIENIKVKASGYDENGKKWEKEEIIEKPKKVHVPADIQAAKFYLLNRARKNWKDNPDKVENDKEMLELRKKEMETKNW